MDTMKRQTPKKPYWKMSAEELAEATKEFDRPIPARKLKPLTKEERARWERSKAKPSASVFVVDHAGGGAEAVIVKLDEGLLRRCDEYARKHKLSRSELIEKSLRSVLSFVE